jgi:benzoyl-CoA reductase subunit D
VVGSPSGSGRGRAGAKVLAAHVERIRRRDQRQVIRAAFDEALAQAKVKEQDLAYVASTGEGELVDFRTGHFYGMTAHTRGAVFLDGRTRAVLDVGALHARAISCDANARVIAYRMTSQCASGTGQFLENIARYLGVTLEEVGSLSLQGDKPEKVSGICAVLAETDVINMVSRGISLPNILRGIHESMASRVAKLVRKLDVMQGALLLTGGLAADVGLTARVRDEIRAVGLPELEVVTHPMSVHAGALGSALWGAYRFERLQEHGERAA